MKKHMRIWKRIVIIFFVSSLVTGCDQGTKSLATEYLPKYESTSYLNDIIRIGYIENTGAFLGLGSNLSNELRFLIFVFAVGTFLLSLLIYLVMSPKQNVYSLVALSLVLGGGISNFFDRATNNGAVVDFLNIGLGSIRTGIFNVADMAILLGMFLFIFFKNKPYANEQKNF